MMWLCRHFSVNRTLFGRQSLFYFPSGTEHTEKRDELRCNLNKRLYATMSIMKTKGCPKWAPLVELRKLHLSTRADL